MFSDQVQDSLDVVSDKAEVACDLDGGAEDPFDGLGVVLPEIAYGVVVRGKALEQPHYLDVPLALLFELSAGAHLVHVAVNLELEQSGETVCRPTVFGEMHLEPQLFYIPTVHKCIHGPYGIFVFYRVLQGYRKEGGLSTVFSFNIHHILKLRSMDMIVKISA